MFTVTTRVIGTIQGKVIYDRERVFKTHSLEVARHYCELNAEWSPVITQGGEIVPPVMPVTHRVRKWQRKARIGDDRTYRCNANGDNFELGKRGDAWGYHFKGFWHGGFRTECEAYEAWRKRPLVGNQGVIADVTGPLKLDMAMF